MERKRATITLKGINTTMGDISVPDGACEELRNVRFYDNSWQSIGVPSIIEDIQIPQGIYDGWFYLTYNHEIDGDPHLIFEGVVKEGTTYRLKLFAHFSQNIQEVCVLHSANSTTTFNSLRHKYSHFGNVLIVATESEMKYFIWSDGKYVPFEIPQPATVVDTLNISFAPENDTTDSKGNYAWRIGVDVRPAGDSVTNRWWGEICYLVAYRMADGTILSPTPLRILCSEEGHKDMNYSPKVKVIGEHFALVPEVPLEGYQWPNLSLLRTILPKLLIKVPNGINTDLIESVAIYSTRINTIPDYEKMFNASKVNGELEGRYAAYYADNKLPDQPLYLVEEVKLKSLSGNKWEVSLGYDKLKDLANGESSRSIYKDVQVHRFVAESFYDFNSRMHFGGLKTTLYSNHSPLYPATIDGVYQELVSVDSIGSVLSQYISRPTLTSAESETYDTITPPDNGDVWMRTPILSYPDYRANRITIVRQNMDEISETDIMLTPALANNFAYYITPTDGIVKYPKEGFLVNRGVESIAESPTFAEPNRIQVSAPNNIFSLPYENSYVVGNRGSKVLAISTVADSLTDSTFYGTYPLYAFTTDGIFALRSGAGTVLYEGVDIVNHDKIMDGKTISLNGFVVYPCIDGLKALSGRESVRISGDLDIRSWKGVEFGVDTTHNELLCLLNDVLYSWNINNKVWATRQYDKRDVLFLSGSNALLYNAGYYKWCDLDNEDDSVGFATIKTRPIKLGSVNSFKKLAALVVRLSQLSETQNYELLVEGSNDLKEWRTLRNVSGKARFSIGIMRFPQSTRFVRITYTASNDYLFGFEGIDVEFTEKYSRQLR